MTATAPRLTGRNQAAIRVAGLAASAVSLWLVLRSVDAGKVAAQFGRADVAPLGLVLVVLTLQLVLRGLRWSILLASMEGGRRIAVHALVPPLLIGYLGNAILPARLGEPTRAYLVARRQALPGAATFGTVVLERVLDTATLGLIALVAALAASAAAWLIQLSALAALAGGAVILLLTTAAGRVVSRLIARVELRSPARLAPLLGFIVGVLTGAEGSRRRGTIAAAAAISGVCWLGDATTFWLVGRALGIALAPGAALLIAAVTVLGTALPSAPGYVGTFELAATTTATVLGIAAAPALALAVLAHAMTLLPLALAGVVSALMLGAGLGPASRTGLAAGSEPQIPPGAGAGPTASTRG